MITIPATNVTKCLARKPKDVDDLATRWPTDLGGIRCLSGPRYPCPPTVYPGTPVSAGQGCPVVVPRPIPVRPLGRLSGAVATSGRPRIAARVLLCGRGRRRLRGARTPSIAGERFVLEAIKSRTRQASQPSLPARYSECDVRQLWHDAVAEAIP